MVQEILQKYIIELYWTILHYTELCEVENYNIVVRTSRGHFGWPILTPHIIQSTRAVRRHNYVYSGVNTQKTMSPSYLVDFGCFSFRLSVMPPLYSSHFIFHKPLTLTGGRHIRKRAWHFSARDNAGRDKRHWNVSVGRVWCGAMRGGVLLRWVVGGGASQLTLSQSPSGRAARCLEALSLRVW